MATNRQIEKPEVFNPLTTLHTVGQELEEAFLAKGVDVTSLGIANLSKKKKLSIKQMSKACKLLGVGEFYIEVLTESQNEYAEREKDCKAQYSKACYNYRRLKQVLPMLKNEFNDGYDRLDDILDFFDLDSEEEVFEHVAQTGALFRTQNQTPINEINLSAWLRRGELDFKKQEQTLPEYDKTAFQNWIDSRVWSTELKNTTYFKSIPKILRDFGVSVVLLPYLQKTVYGAVKWIDNHPVIMISDREQDLATCWFTLFHEFGHVILHASELAIIDGMINGGTSKTKSEKREREANKFANTYLFGGDDLRKHIFDLKRNNDYEPQDQIAINYKVNTIFVGYWMRKAQYYPAHHQRTPISFG